MQYPPPQWGVRITGFIAMVIIALTVLHNIRSGQKSASNTLLAAKPSASIVNEAGDRDTVKPIYSLSFAPLVKKVIPTVVNIAVTLDEIEASTRKNYVPPTIKGTPLEKEYKNKMRRRQSHKVFGEGSGFIIDSKGIIVTNYHVIEGAEKIIVSLQDGTELPATIVGHDILTDIAVLKIQTKRPLPTIKWGNSQKVEVGDWILVVGNPFGLGSSIMTGLLSARGRNIGAGPFDDFFQLDAPINPGNSGGPAFNMKGEVVGLNTAILSPTGSSVGIGFAIPSQVAIPIIDQLRLTGHIERGWLGLTLEDTSDKNGVRVVGVEPHGPGQKGGIRKNDVIQSLDNDHVDSVHSLIRGIAALKPNTTVSLHLLRKHNILSVKITVGVRPENTK